MNKLKKVFAVLLVAVMFLSTAPTVNAAGTTIDTTKSVDFTIHKYDNTTVGDTTDGTKITDNSLDGYTALENVKFKMYKTNLAQTPNAYAEMPSADTVSKNKSTYGITGAANYTLITDEDGEATQTVPSAMQGIYLVEEVSNPAISNPADLGKPFLVSLPTTTKDGDGWNYDVHAYPKNKVVDGPDIDKEVLDADNGVKKGVNVGDDVTWRITTEISDDLYFKDEDNKESYAKLFQITDTLNKALTYKSITFKTRVNANAGVTLTLTENTDYKVVNTADGENTKMVFTLTQTGMKKVKLAQSGKATHFMVEVTTTVNEHALTVDEVTNDATLNYENNLGVDFEKNTKDDKPTDPTKPGVNTGSTGFTKYVSGTTDKLAGVTFVIADTKANATAGKFIKKDSKGKIYFPGDAGYDAAPVYEVTTTDTGIVKFQGLKYTLNSTTSYWIVETKTPSGYQLLAEPFEVKVGANSNLDKQIGSVSVYNNKKFALPNTGGTGTVVFTVAGIALMGTALLLIKKSKKSKVN